MIERLLLNEDFENDYEELDIMQKHRFDFELDRIEDEEGKFVVAVDVNIDESDNNCSIVKGHWSDCKLIIDGTINF